MQPFSIVKEAKMYVIGYRIRCMKFSAKPTEFLTLIIYKLLKIEVYWSLLIRIIKLNYILYYRNRFMMKAFALLTLVICFFSHSTYCKIGVMADTIQTATLNVLSHKVWLILGIL